MGRGEGFLEESPSLILKDALGGTPEAPLLACLMDSSYKPCSNTSACYSKADGTGHATGRPENQGGLVSLASCS
jgi:hypothetical protein